MSDRPAILPAHIEDTVASIAQVHAKHDRESGPTQRFVNATTVFLARPRTLGVLTVLIIGWVALNLALPYFGRPALDPPPFSLLADAASILGLYLAAMILITQRHDDNLATHRDQLTLELAILGERKTAKIIELLEQSRRDDPTRGDSQDAEAEQLSQPADPEAVLDAIKAAQSQGTQDPGVSDEARR